jgi:Protein of unknown function (DUF1592)/Protein of unknown function (DUF1588)/Protein of unknown function (DUF1595)/Protein of unknown function (DUF1587)
MPHCGIKQAVPVLALLVGTGCTDGNTSSPSVSPVRLPSASPATLSSSVPIRRLRRLSNREYNNVVRDLLGDTTQPAKRFVVDVYPNGYDNGSAGLAVQSDQVVDYQAAAEALAAAAVQRGLGGLLGGCDPAAQGDQACLDALLASFAPRAYRRPLTEPERQRLRDVFQGETQANGFARGIQTVLEVILQSPQFLYREELGAIGVAPSPGSDVRLTDDEVASELSFLLTGSNPDADLRTAVANGSFTTPEDYQREAARLLATQGAKDTLRAFLHQWLATNRLAYLSKDSAAYPSFDPAMAASMASEIDAFFDSVLWPAGGSLRALFTSSQSFADATLGQIYGVPVDGAALVPVALDPQLRPGILTRAGFLAVHSATDSSGPIERGVFLLGSIMCSPPPPPPPNVPPAPPAADPSVQGLSTRQRFAQHVSNPFCATCHTRIDGVGFGFEEFDGLGAYRDVDNGQPVDSSGSIVGTGEIDGDFHGVGELATRLSGSRLLANCYARQAYRFAMGDVEPAQGDLRWLTSSSSPDASMTAVLLALVGSPKFVTREFE